MSEQIKKMTKNRKNNKQQKPAAGNKKEEEKVDTNLMVDEVPEKSQQGVKRKNEKVTSSGEEPTLESLTKKAKKETNDTEEYINATQDPTFTGKITTNSSKIYKNILLISNLALSVDEIVLKGCMNEIAEASGNSAQKLKEILIFQKNLSSKESEALASNALRNAQKNTNNKQATLIQGPKAAIVIFEKEFANAQVFEDYNGAIIEGIPINIRFACENDKACLMVVKGAPITEEELWSYVEECGSLVSIESSKSNKNQFMILFKEWRSVRECLLYNGADVHGAPCRIFACMFPAPTNHSSKFKGGNKGGKKY